MQDTIIFWPKNLFCWIGFVALNYDSAKCIHFLRPIEKASVTHDKKTYFKNRFVEWCVTAIVALYIESSTKWDYYFWVTFVHFWVERKLFEAQKQTTITKSNQIKLVQIRDKHCKYFRLANCPIVALLRAKYC